MSLRVAYGRIPYGEARERAGEAVPAGERLVQSEVVLPGVRMKRPALRRRPKVMAGRRLPGDRWEGTKRIFWKVYDIVDWIPDPFGRQRKKGKPLSGGWGSLAGQLAAAIWPRVPTTDALVLLQLTDRRLHVTYVQRGRRRGVLGVVEAGWSTAAGQVAWIRHRTDIDADTYELGFVDDSWVRVALPSQHASSFVECFPRGRQGA